MIRYLSFSIAACAIMGFFLLSAVSHLHAQQWYRLGTNNNGLQLLDDNVIVVVGQAGRIIRSTDDGITWNQQQPHTGQNLNSLYFFDKQTGVVVGDSGLVMSTNDAGTHWERVSAGTTARLRSITAAGTNTLIAVGNSIIIRSTDRGVSWSEVLSDTNRLLASVRMNDSLHGIAVGSNGTGGAILRTTDGGVHWENVSIDGVQFLYDAVYYSTDTVVAVGSRFQSLLSTNGGATWESTSLTLQKTSFSLLKAMKSISGELIGIGQGEYDGNIWRSSDLGRTWQVSSNGATGTWLSPTRAIGQRNDGTLWAVGDESVIQRSTDDGNNWNTMTWLPLMHELSIAGSAYVNKVVMPGNNVAGAAELAGYFRTTDTGVTWNRVYSLNGFEDIHFFDATYGVAVGGFAKYYQTHDTGATWNDAPALPGIDYHTISNHGWSGVEYFDREHGVVYGDSTNLFYTSNGGTSWQQGTFTPPISRIFDLAYAGPRHLVCTAFLFNGNFNDPLDYFIYASSDGGASWQQMAAFPKERFIPLGVGAIDSLRWFVAARQYNAETKLLRGVLFRTDNGGANWDTLDIDGGRGLAGVTFFNDTAGYAYGSGIWSTNDAGMTWQRESLADAGLSDTVTFNTITSMAISPNGRTLIAGGSGVILRRDFPAPLRTLAVPAHYDNAPALLMQCFPNPVHGTATLLIHEPAGLYNETHELRIYDALGHMVADMSTALHQQQNGISATLPVEQFPTGMYTARLRVGGQVASCTFVVSR